MKRTLSILLAFLLCLGILPTGAKAAKEPAALNLGETQTLDFVEFTLTKADLYNKIKVGSWYIEAPEGKKYLMVSGPIKNTFNSNYSLDGVTGEIKIDDKYSFQLNVRCVEGTSFNIALDPFAKGTLYLYAEVPEELSSTFTSAAVRFGFNENLAAKPKDLESADYSYEILVSMAEDAQNPIDTHAFSPVKYKLKDTVKGTSLKITFTKKITGNKAKFKYKNGWTMNYSAASGRKYVGLSGTVTNTSKSELQPRVTGYVLIGGIKYSLETSTVNDYKLAAKGKDTIFVYAEIPNSVLKKNSSAKIYFGYDDGFTNGYDAEVEDCQYTYVYTVKFK